MRPRQSKLHDRNAELGGWDGAAKDLPTGFLDSRKRLLGAQQLMSRKGEDSCHAGMLSGFDLNTTQEQRDAARLRI